MNINYHINHSKKDTKFCKYDRNIGKDADFMEIINIIKCATLKKYSLQNNNSVYKVLYLRNDSSRRRMICYNGELDHLFDEVVVDMGSKTFEEQVKLFNKTTHFVTIEGAHMTNILFMNSNTKILIFSPTNNSWQKMFGTYKLVKYFKIFITGGNFNDNIKYNDLIKTNILDFVK